MVNEGHDDLRRCTRTRDIGVRMIAPAHAAGVRHLAVEALTPDLAAAANRERRLGPGSGYMAQSDLRALMMTALEHDWSLTAYFCIDQTVTIHLNAPDRESPIARRHRRVLGRFGGTAGFLLGGTGLPLTPVRWVYRGVDAVIYSLHNELE